MGTLWERLVARLAGLAARRPLDFRRSPTLSRTLRDLTTDISASAGQLAGDTATAAAEVAVPMGKTGDSR